jgi:hypothetical protein
MNGPEIERLVTAALYADAEDAMNRTSTTRQLQSLIETSGRDARGRRRAQVIGALAALAAAAVVVALVVSWPGGTHRTAPPLAPTRAEQVTEAEQMAGAFMGALATFDRTTAAAYVAAGAHPTMGNIMGDITRDDAWPLRNRWDEATGWRVTNVDRCHGTGLQSGYINVRCPFTAHQLGSDKLGRGPFGNNVLTVTVRHGEIVDTTLTTGDATNGFAHTMWNPFWAWMGQTHPNDEPSMRALEDPGASAARVATSLRLWHLRMQQYVDAVRAGRAR